MRSSWRLRASALGRPGCCATASSLPSLPRSWWTTRAQTASTPSGESGDSPRSESALAATTAASRPSVNRCQPKAAPDSLAQARTSSAAASGVAPTTRARPQGPKARSHCRARSSRGWAAADVTSSLTSHSLPQGSDIPLRTSGLRHLGMLLLPVRVEDAEVDRVPAISVAIAAACAVTFVITWILPANPDGMRAEGFREIVRYYEDHPYLELQPRFLYDYLSPHARASLEEMREEQPVTVDTATLTVEQPHLDSLVEGFEAEAESSLLRRLGLVPARGLLQPGWLTHMFLHFGWMHILGNLFFFYLVGPLLEDLWGRKFFAGFYLLGGLAAAVAHFALDPRSAVVMAGASGAIAACMGAFSYRCASRRIRMWYLIFWIRSGTFLIPAWVWGGFWFAGEVFSMVTQSSGGVAVMAHIGGFLFGFCAAVALEKSGYEQRALAPAVQRKTTWTQHVGTDAARRALDRGDSRAAADAYRTVVKDRPMDREAAVGLSRIEQDPRAAVVLLHALASKGEIAQAWEVAIELGPVFDPDKLPDKLAYQLAGTGDPPEGAGDLPERLDVAVGRRKGPLAAKALLRAAKRCFACGRVEQGQTYLEEARALPDLQPAMRAQLDAVQKPPRGAVRAWAWPRAWWPPRKAARS